jgi:hypothetical protein
MERDLFEHIVMSVCKSESKTKQVIEIVYGTSQYLKCDNNHYYVNTNLSCPYCKPNYGKEIGSFRRCQNGHFYRKELNKCNYCEPILEPKKISKKQELIDSLDYLKKKDHKTEKDRESISIIQAILNGMK